MAETLYAGQSRVEREAGRRERLTAAAVHLFATRPYDEVTVADVCTHAKVGKRYFYQHFADRGDLLTAVHHELNEGLLAELTAITPPRPASVFELIRPTMHALVRLLRADLERARVIYINAPRMELRRRGLLRDEAEMFARLLRPVIGTPEDETQFFRTLLAALAGVSEVVIDWVSGGFPDPPDVLAEQLTLIAVAMLGSVPVRPAAGR
jgi:AcrR family transcriptional regulator